MTNIFAINNTKDISFKLYRYKYNSRSAFILNIMDLLISICIIVLTKMGLIDLDYSSTLFASIPFIILWCLFFLTINYSDKKNSIFFHKILFLSYIIPAFYINTFIKLFDVTIGFALGTYPIFILTHCLFFSFSITESFFLFIPIACIEVFHLSIFISKDPLLNTLLFNITLTNLLAFLYSIYNYNSSKKIYSTHLVMYDALNERDILNEKLNEHQQYITDFFINISHDLKAPLNVIYGSQQLLEKQILSNNIDYDKASKYVKSIKLNSIRLTRLLNNVLDISKLDASKFKLNLKNLDLVTTIENITDSLVDFMSSKSINLQFDTDFEEMILALDEEKLERIILNLLSNSLKFTPPGGEIIIHLYYEDNFVYVSIKDTGIGISEEAQENIFNRFVQVNAAPINEMSGSGIGLSLVKSLMLLHKGDILVESEVNKGSNFILKFPMVNIEETLEDDIINGSIYPSTSSSTSTYLEFAGLSQNTNSININS